MEYPTTNQSEGTPTKGGDSNTDLKQDVSMIFPQKEKYSLTDFEIRALLGQGSFGAVFLVEQVGTKNLYAMKVLDKSYVVKENLLKYAKGERNILAQMDCPFIVSLHFAFQTTTKLFLILEYCPCGDLGRVLSKEKRFSEEVARIYICEVILALEYLHFNGIIYRDLKPDNLIFDKSGHIKLTDFGLSKMGVRDHFSSQSICGSYAYLAPEMVAQTGHGMSMDWYGVGVLLYEFLTGVPPHYSKNFEQLKSNILNGPLQFPVFLSEDAKDLMKKLLNKNPLKRLGAEGGAQEIRSHPWFKDVDWDAVAEKRTFPPDRPEKRVRKIGSTDLTLFFQEAPLSAKESGRLHFENWSYVKK